MSLFTSLSKHKMLPRFAVAVLAAVIAACTPYRIDVQQGNYLTQKEISQLKTGMSKREVRYILGTPLIVDPFHENRWEYFYSLRKGRQDEVQRRRVTVVFAGDEVASIEGVGQLPSAAAASSGGTVVTEATDKRKKKGFIKRTIDRIKGGDDGS